MWDKTLIMFFWSWMIYNVYSIFVIDSNGDDGNMLIMAIYLYSQSADRGYGPLLRFFCILIVLVAFGNIL